MIVAPRTSFVVMGVGSSISAKDETSL